MTPHPPAQRSVPGAARALAHCHELARISSLDDAIERVHLSTEHKIANALAAAWMQEVGLDTWVDEAGNLCGRLEGHKPGLPALVLGSHLDTVTDAGAYDGMLGVMLAIEVVDRIRRSGRRLPFALEVVGFTDEEGTRFGNALMGSRAFAGLWDPAWTELEDRKGVTLRDAAKNFGLDPDAIGDAARRSEDLVGYLETHIEQGPSLLDADRALAVVSSIAGARRLALTVTGRAGHAGGTPYARRRDALVGASEIIVEIERIAKRTDTVATVGRVRAFPGGVNVVPGVARFSLDLRAESDERRDAAFEEIEAFARDVCERRGLAWQADEFYRADAVVCDPALRFAVEQGIRATGDDEPMVLWSRAGHDGMAVQAVTGFAMLFLRCGNDGVSHHPDEIVAESDVEAALDAFEATVLAVADARG
ncbi:allantoate amidohydrolase [Herbiconiux sp. L3-i23]|uniref:allantoate amidohydrolase n=1 Tax=Herbiconiux sp. L3-i23 TaxID=2905871 RepID=UPI00206989E7|nr:allantoate amidohydrolase [Herbiconiux sp. L3-i23]BDI21411.1 Zn-dependent hydrolase [Herbiconiux sp. L3-i23]